MVHFPKAHWQLPRGILIHEPHERPKTESTKLHYLSLPQDVINSVHCLACRNPMGLDIRDRGRRPFLEVEEGSDNDADDSTYAPSDEDNRNNGDESDDDEATTMIIPTTPTLTRPLTDKWHRVPQE